MLRKYFTNIVNNPIFRVIKIGAFIIGVWVVFNLVAEIFVNNTVPTKGYFRLDGTYVAPRGDIYFPLTNVALFVLGLLGIIWVWGKVVGFIKANIQGFKQGMALSKQLKLKDKSLKERVLIGLGLYRDHKSQ